MGWEGGEGPLFGILWLTYLTKTFKPVGRAKALSSNIAYRGEGGVGRGSLNVLIVPLRSNEMSLAL